MHLGQVVARYAEKDVAEHRRQRFDEDHLPGQGQQQDWRQQQIGHQQAEDQAHGAAYQQVGGHGAHLLHQLAPQLLEENSSDHPKEGTEAAQHGAQPFWFVHLQQQLLGQPVYPKPAGGGARHHKQDQDEGVHHSRRAWLPN